MNFILFFVVLFVFSVFEIANAQENTPFSVQLFNWMIMVSYPLQNAALKEVKPDKLGQEGDIICETQQMIRAH